MLKYVLTTILFLKSFIAFCQQEPNIDPVEIKIVKDYNVFIEEATKIHEPINYYPKFKDKSLQKKISFSLPDRIENFKFEPSSIEPIAYKQRNLFFNNTNFLKLGFGSALNPILEWSHHNQKAKTPSRIHVFHHSAWYSPDSFQKYSESQVTAQFSKSYKGWIVNPKINGNHKYYNFFGNLSESGYQKEANRNYLNANFHTTIHKEKTGIGTLSAINVLEANYGRDILGIFDTTRKNHEFYAQFGSNLSYKMKDYFALKLSVNTQYYNLTVDTFTDKWLINAMPHGEFKSKTLKLTAGLNFTQTIVNSRPVFYILPHVISEIQILPNFINFFTQWNRTIDLNRMQNHLASNPFAIFSQQLLPNTITENRTAGFKGSYSGFSYQAFFNQKVIKNALLFKNNDMNPRFLFSQIEQNMIVNNVSLEISYVKEEKWSTFMKGDIFLYEIDRANSIPYNLPGQRLTLGANFKAGNRWNIHFIGFALGGVKTEYNGQEKTNPILVDLNLGVEFLISKNFYIFANGNNLLDSKIANQIGFPTLGINGQGGIRLSY